MCIIRCIIKYIFIIYLLNLLDFNLLSVLYILRGDNKYKQRIGRRCEVIIDKYIFITRVSQS